MKRLWILAGVVILLGGIVYVLQKNKKDPDTNIDRAESNFRIENPLTIGRIILTNKNGSRSDLKRVGDRWTINDQYKARQSSVDVLLTGILPSNPGKFRQYGCDDPSFKKNVPYSSCVTPPT